jgi:hypothetical protein
MDSGGISKVNRSKRWISLSAVAMTFLVAGTVLAATGPSDQGVTPTEIQGNITLAGGGGNDAAECAVADGLETGNSSGSGTTESGVSVEWTYDADTKEFSFEAEGGVVLIAYIKGSNSYNEYDYTGLGGVTEDGGMFAPDNNNAPAGLSHADFCTGEEEETTSFTSSQQSTTDSQSSSTTSTETTESTTTFSDSVSESTTTQPPSDTLGDTGSGQQSGSMWLLLAALGVLAGSVIVLAPSKAKSKE